MLRHGYLQSSGDCCNVSEMLLIGPKPENEMLPAAAARGQVGEEAGKQVSGSRRLLVEELVEAVLSGRAVVSVQGERGIGKTTVLEAVAAKLKDDRVVVVRIQGGICSRDELQQSISSALCAPSKTTLDAADLLRALLNQLYRTELAILIDDADALTPAAFRYLRVLLDVFNNLEPNLHLLMVGAAETWDGLRQLDGETLEKLAPAPLFISALPNDEAKVYLQQSLLQYPTCSRLMTARRFKSILRTAKGNPAAIDVALADWREQVDFAQASVVAPNRRFTVSAQVGVAAILMVLFGVVVTAQVPSFQDYIYGKLTAYATPATFESADVGRVDTFSAAIATARNNAPLSQDRRIVTVPTLRFGPANTPSSAVSELRTESAPAIFVPDHQALTKEPPARSAAPFLPPAAVLGPNAEPAAIPPIMPNPSRTDLVGTAVVPPQHPVTLVEPAPLMLPPVADLPSSAPDTARDPGMVFVARRGDTLGALYAKVYRDTNPPPFEVFLEANPKPVTPGAIVVFPTPIKGWTRR